MRLDCKDIIEEPGEPACFFCGCGRKGFSHEMGWQLVPETPDDRQLMCAVFGTDQPFLMCTSCAEAYGAPIYGPVHWVEDMQDLRAMLPEGGAFGRTPPGPPPRGFDPLG